MPIAQKRKFSATVVTKIYSRHHPHLIKLDEHPADDRSTLAMLTINSMAISDIQIRQRFASMENLIEAETANLHTLYGLVLQGISFVSGEC